ncbi:hypothetical protein [Bacillus suaedaesalsae]|uniref:t-SNARE coiled-coil homology domain-containing protein n=1 Tax=Bacillus suaedaesalsae TaxID=2810349 RepID=A0ABS2DLZ0_9BACI|nr:hypothetical protein [Bacillus suaedaesalsae]MBM6619473.1 hypothetical protein [Bacillus suaedaesalsae]
MGIDRNNRIKPKLFTSSINNANSNQHLYRTSPMTKFIEEQQKVNERISESYTDVYDLMKVAKTEQNKYFTEVITQIQKQEHTQTRFGNRMEQQELVNQTLLDRILHLEKINLEMKKKLESDEIIHQAILDGLTAQDNFGQKISQKIFENEGMLDTINDQLSKQEELYKNLSETLALQEAFHKTIMERLDQQEAITQKISRQIDHLKSIIFERFSFITEKLENSWKTTSNYLFGYLSKSDDKHETEEEFEETRKQ